MAILNDADVDLQLDKVVGEVSANRKRLTEATEAVAARVVNLNDIPNRYGDLVETVQAVDYGDDAYRSANKARLSSIIAEYQALVAEAATVRDWLNANTTEF